MTIELPDGFTPNPGYCPEEAIGKRVRVFLRKGTEPIYDDHFNPMSPPGWAADGKGKCRWAKDGSPHDILGFMIL